MKKLLLFLPLILCSCDVVNTSLYNHNGHQYIRFKDVMRTTGFVHDPDCPKCKEQSKAALQEMKK